MARLRRPSFSDDEGDGLGKGTWIGQTTKSTAKGRASLRKTETKVYEDPTSPALNSSLFSPKLVAKTPNSGLRQRKQIQLRPLNAALMSNPPPAFEWSDEQVQRPRRTPSPRKSIRRPTVYDDLDSSSESDGPTREETLWNDSSDGSDQSDDDLPSPSKLVKRSLKSGKNLSPKSSMINLRRSLKDLRMSFRTDDLGAPPTVTPGKVPPVPAMPDVFATRLSSSSSDKENDGDDHILHFSPPRLHSPRKVTPSERSTTPPPASPSKGKLISPSKKKPKMPTPPHRPSLDAFWDSETVNNWTDQHSPRKEWKSPAKLKQMRVDGFTSPISSPRKLQSPSKRTKAEIEAKKSWEARKHGLADSFLNELDQKVAGGQIAQLAASTGGVKVIWSKTLNSTAGRANWKCQTTKTTKADGTITVVHDHNASIELAEKVIDDEERLLNVLAHEFCHLCNFMISGVKDQPHGKSFKAWGAKATAAFASREVEVTTKHRYQIEYKYIWACSNDDCTAEFKRHSKSIDPSKHTCGNCRSKLLQIKPAPRKANANGESTGYAAFVKTHFAAVKKGLAAGSTQKEIMQAVARLYREKKNSPDVSEVGIASEKDTTDGEMDSMAKMLDVITIKD
ncbi:Hypothetical protein R9X50_00716800 [Acrodontium crateriforme]|uniref:SprT-like domain-containing protein n=1 Tax=Acrodontium crateriforme TaxID=150365 RepID=A0AAQ3M9R2_9PEZI|nr:Hypothetical protein R9X50_00716800 [Acrodontium crateriforme]